MNKYAIEFAENTHSCVKLIELLGNVNLLIYIIGCRPGNIYAKYFSPYNDNLLIWHILYTSEQYIWVTFDKKKGFEP